MTRYEYGETEINGVWNNDSLKFVDCHGTYITCDVGTYHVGAIKTFFTKKIKLFEMLDLINS